MALVVDQLQLWTIGFKWAGLDPNRTWRQIPATVGDNFTTLLYAILNGELECSTLALEKYYGDDPEIAKCHIGYWTEDVNAGVNGKSYSGELLKHAVIERWALQDWCERRTIPLPEFWFPPGCTGCRSPEQDELIPTEWAELAPDHQRTSSHETVEPALPDLSGTGEHSHKQLHPAQLAKIVCKQIATVIWKKSPTMTIADMCRDQRIQELGGGEYYSEELVRSWVKEAAPEQVSAEAGRPTKKNSTEDD